MDADFSIEQSQLEMMAEDLKASLEYLKNHVTSKKAEECGKKEN